MYVKMRNTAAENINVNQFRAGDFSQSFTDTRQNNAEGLRFFAVEIGNIGNVAFRFEISKTFYFRI
jgi:hypothetical protein